VVLTGGKRSLAGGLVEGISNLGKRRGSTGSRKEKISLAERQGGGKVGAEVAGTLIGRVSIVVPGKTRKGRAAFTLPKLQSLGDDQHKKRTQMCGVFQRRER